MCNCIEHDEDALICDLCGNGIPEGAPHHFGGDTCICEACAPTWKDFLTHPESFYDPTNNPVTPEAAKAAYDEHIASGGSPDDKMVTA